MAVPIRHPGGPHGFMRDRAHLSRTSIGVSPSVRTEHPTGVLRAPCQPCFYHRSPHSLVGSYGTPPPVGVGLGRPASTAPIGTGREWVMVALIMQWSTDLPTLKNKNSYFDIQKFLFCTKKLYFLKLISQNAF